jgi:hypothetical protein
VVVHTVPKPTNDGVRASAETRAGQFKGTTFSGCGLIWHNPWFTRRKQNCELDNFGVEFLARTASLDPTFEFSIVSVISCIVDLEVVPSFGRSVVNPK